MEKVNRVGNPLEASLFEGFENEELEQSPLHIDDDPMGSDGFEGPFSALDAAEIHDGAYEGETPEGEPGYMPAEADGHEDGAAIDDADRGRHVATMVGSLPAAIANALRAFDIDEQELYLKVRNNPGRRMTWIGDGNKDLAWTRKTLRKLAAAGLVKVEGKRKNKIFYPCEGDAPQPEETLEGYKAKCGAAMTEIADLKAEICKMKDENTDLKISIKAREHELSAMNAGTWMKQVRSLDETLEANEKMTAAVAETTEKAAAVANEQMKLIKAVSESVEKAAEGASAVLGPDKPDREDSDTWAKHWLIAMPAYWLTKARYVDWVRHFLWIVLFCATLLAGISSGILYVRCAEQEAEIQRLAPYEPKYNTLKRWLGFDGEGKWVRRSDELDVMYAKPEAYRENLDALNKRIGLPSYKYGRGSKNDADQNNQQQINNERQ